MSRIAIVDYATLSSLGDQTESLESYQKQTLNLLARECRGRNFFTANVNESKLEKYKIRKSLQGQDRTVLLALHCAESLKLNNSKRFGINIGSSRGATGYLENCFYQFMSKGDLPLLTSPLSTLGNISSKIAQELKLSGLALSHSVTCSTALHAVCNAYAWIKSGMLDSMLAGGSEAPLTDFTLNQMEALRIYTKNDSPYPCRPFEGKQNTFMLGEGAALFHITKSEQGIELAGLGFAQEQTPSATGITPEGTAFYLAMQAACQQANVDKVDLIIAHAPGTVRGDQSEYNAIKKLFSDVPYIISNKYLTGHTFGASGALSLELGILALEKQLVPKFPYDTYLSNTPPKTINSVLVNAAGFGGNAVSILLKK